MYDTSNVGNNSVAAGDQYRGSQKYPARRVDWTFPACLFTDQVATAPDGTVQTTDPGERGSAASAQDVGQDEGGRILRALQHAPVLP